MKSFPLLSRPLSRAHFLGVAAVSLSTPLHGPLRLNSSDEPKLLGAFGPTANAYRSLAQSMDLYASGSTPRLAQSYKPTTTFTLGDLAFTYDNAVAVMAFLARGTVDDVARARTLGDALLLVQSTDSPMPDGRVRDWYHAASFGSAMPGAFAGGSGAGGSATGNIAWAGLALAHLFAATRDPRYLTGAMALGSWTERNTHDTRGAGGYTGGERSDGTFVTFKATEHNIDLYALFTELAQLTGDRVWNGSADHALTFVRAMWDASAGHFWTGVGSDGISINRDVVPEDVQAWSWLALRDRTFTGALDWAARSLSAAGPFGGVAFSDADRSATWCEGTAHLATALLDRGHAGDWSLAGSYLQSLGRAQTSAPNADGWGIVAATRDGLHTGFGDDYFASIHLGATAWSLLAAAHRNPFRL